MAIKDLTPEHKNPFATIPTLLNLNLLWENFH